MLKGNALPALCGFRPSAFIGALPGKKKRPFRANGSVRACLADGLQILQIGGSLVVFQVVARQVVVDRGVSL